MSTIIGKFVPVGEPDGRKEFHVTTMKKRGDGWVGLKEDETKSYHVYNSYWKFEPIWNGEGLPPVGVECVLTPHNTRWGFSGSSPYRGVVVAYSGEDFWFKDSSNVNTVSRTDKVDFRPIRTEAERKREEAIDALIKADPSATTCMINAIYNAISAGKIPGVELKK